MTSRFWTLCFRMTTWGTETTVREFQPELIGISLRNQGNSSYMDPNWALPTTKEVIQRIRTITSGPIVCVGPGFSLLDLRKRAGSRLIIIKGIAGQNLVEESLEDRLEPVKEIWQRCDPPVCTTSFPSTLANQGKRRRRKPRQCVRLLR